MVSLYSFDQNIAKIMNEINKINHKLNFSLTVIFFKYGFQGELSRDFDDILFKKKKISLKKEKKIK